MAVRLLLFLQTPLRATGGANPGDGAVVCTCQAIVADAEHGWRTGILLILISFPRSPPRDCPTSRRWSSSAPERRVPRLPITGRNWGMAPLVVIEMNGVASGSAGRVQGLVVMGRYYYYVHATTLDFLTRTRPDLDQAARGSPSSVLSRLRMQLLMPTAR